MLWILPSLLTIVLCCILKSFVEVRHTLFKFLGQIIFFSFVCCDCLKPLFSLCGIPYNLVHSITHSKLLSLFYLTWKLKDNYTIFQLFHASRGRCMAQFWAMVYKQISTKFWVNFLPSKKVEMELRLSSWWSIFIHLKLDFMIRAIKASCDGSVTDSPQMAPKKHKKLLSLMASLVAQTVKVLSPGWEDPLKKEMATHSSTLAWKIPWTEEHGRLQSTGQQRVRHDLATSLSFTF